MTELEKIRYIFNGAYNLYRNEKQLAKIAENSDDHENAENHERESLKHYNVYLKYSEIYDRMK